MRPKITTTTAVAILSVSLLLSLVLMSAAIQNSARFGTLFSILIITNCVGLFAFAVLLILNARELIGQLRRHQPGARLMLRMLVIFVVLSVLPIVVLYGFSIDFLRRGVDSWFDVRIDQALQNSLDLSRAALDLRMRELLIQTEKLADDIGEGGSPTTVLNLDALRNPESTVVANSWDASSGDLDSMRQHSGADELSLVTPQGALLGSSSGAADLVPSIPPEAVLLQLRQGHSYIGLEPRGSHGFTIHAAVNVPNGGVGERKILHAVYPLTERLGTLADSVEAAYAKYHELVYLRDKLQLSFEMTLTLVLLSSIATAAWAAFYSAQRLASPINDLAAGTAAVAAGDYATMLPVTSNDEIGFLVSSFNAMTHRVASARAEVENQHRYVNTLLSQLSSGVLALDHDLLITTLNDSGRQILDLGEAEITGKSLTELPALREHLHPFVEGIAQHLTGGNPRWQQEVQIFSRSGRRMLMCRGTSLSPAVNADAGYVIVFDDITALVKGQRDAAWSEVARRLAHEIKNPLTPIQLSAERLRQKYLSKMAPADADTLDRLTSTIVQQVDTMKAMVNTFSDYARPAVINHEPVDINKLLGAVVDLYKSANPEAKFVLNFDQSLPSLVIDTGRFRQVFNNLIKNALEAQRQNPAAEIQVDTTQLCSDSRNHVQIEIRDSGEGINSAIVDTVFEPYVTNKTRGTGLGLAIVKKIVEEHGGVVTLENNAGPGATATIRLPLDSTLTVEPIRKSS